MNRINLFCFSYAGGSASAVFNKWKDKLHASICLIPVELPGKGNRHRESPCTDIGEAVNDVLDQIGHELDKCDYAFFGYSMGSILACEIINTIRNRNMKLPVHAFLASRYPPNVIKDRKVLHLLSDEEFKNEALKLGGIPEKLLRFKGLLKSSLDMLRADYRLIETYKPNEQMQKFQFDISVMAGRKDELLDEKDIDVWKTYTEKKCSVYWFEGGHFFIHDSSDEITRIINNTLTAE